MLRLPIKLSHRLAVPAALAAIVIAFVAVVRAAWLCDDIYISLRTVDNFVNGFGLRWNIAERVQSFTHPLWLFLLTIPYFFTREPYYTTLGVCFALTALSLVLIGFVVSTHRFVGAAAVLVLAASHAFVAYSTSGLENALSNVLIVVYLFFLLRAENAPRRMLSLSLCASLLLLNRADFLFLLAPSLAFELIAARSWRATKELVFGMLPMAAWELFSLVYYGALVPNTAYAKLTHHVAANIVHEQGWRWFYYTLRWDWVTGATIGVAAIIAIITRSRRAIGVAIGCFFYVGYLIAIGGDFMGGRFWVAPFVFSVALLAAVPNWRVAVPLCMLAVSSFWLPVRPIAFGGDPARSLGYEHGVWDERHSYFPQMSLAHVGLHHVGPSYPWATDGLVEGRKKRVTVQSAIGMYGYYAGPNVFIIDDFALADPLLARVPPIENHELHVGHLRREIPEGYVASTIGKNQIFDPSLHEFYDHLRLIERGPIWSRARFRQIVRLNLGQDRPLLRAYEQELRVTKRHFDMFVFFTDAKDVAHCETCLKFAESAELIAKRPTSPGAKCTLLAESGQRFNLTWLRGDALLGNSAVDTGGKNATMMYVPLPQPDAVAKNGFDRLLIRPAHGNPMFHIGGIECPP